MSIIWDSLRELRDMMQDNHFISSERIRGAFFNGNQFQFMGLNYYMTEKNRPTTFSLTKDEVTSYFFDNGGALRRSDSNFIGEIEGEISDEDNDSIKKNINAICKVALEFGCFCIVQSQINANFDLSLREIDYCINSFQNMKLWQLNTIIDKGDVFDDRLSYENALIIMRNDPVFTEDSYNEFSAREGNRNEIFQEIVERNRSALLRTPRVMTNTLETIIDSQGSELPSTRVENITGVIRSRSEFEADISNDTENDNGRY